MPRPNILLVTSDQQHPAALGCENPEVRTPHLDRLARQGTLFGRAYCPNPTCTPSRASIITGLYPSQHGAWALGTRLDERIPTVGGILGEAGYDCSLIGKAHFQPLKSTPEHPSLEAYPVLHDMEYWRRFHGPYYGFNHVELARNHADEAHVGQHYALWLEEKGAKDWRRHFQPPTGTTPAQFGRWSIPEELHYNTWIVERTIARLERSATRRDEPFFLWASFFDPHPPYLVPEPWDTLYDPARLTVPEGLPGEHAANPPHFHLTQEEAPDFSPWQETVQMNHGLHTHRRSREQRARELAIYYGMISLMDAGIGRILKRLEDLGLAEDTLVVFTSDHGHFLGQHGLVAKGPFHYEDLIRVPFVVRWPGHVPAGGRSPALQSLVDLAPTFLAAAGQEDLPSMSGCDQLPVWTGAEAQARDHVLVENRHQPTAIHLRTYVDERFKITVYRDRPYGELFDLREDPGETHNRWSDPAMAEVRSQLLLKLAHAELSKEPLSMPRIAVA
jgi:uncharacterized sulfatase